MKRAFLTIFFLGMLLPVWGQYPPEAREPGFGVHTSRLVQMDNDPALEEVFLFSRDNGHYPYFDIFRVYYVIVDHATQKLKYKSGAVLVTERELKLEDRNQDGIYELYRSYFRDGQFSTDKEGNHLQAAWVHDCICMSRTGFKETVQTPVNGKIVVAYVISWEDYMPDPNVVTHINYAFGHVNETFNGVRIDNEERLKKIVALKKEAPRLKVLVSIGGWGSGQFSEMAANDTLRKRFAKDCQRIVKEFNLDGIDIDWEYPTQDMAKISASPDDTKNYTLLMRDIREAIGKNKLLTQATVSSAAYMDHKALDPYIDFTNIMAYDMGNPPLHHSALYHSDKVKRSADEAVKAHLAAGVPKHKLVMGMPLYGRAVKGFERPKDLTKAHEMEGYPARWDSVALVPYLTDASGDMVFCYENPESLRIKCRYIIDQNLLGGMYWEYGGDNENGDLTRLVYENIVTPTNLSAQKKIRTLLITCEGGSHWLTGGSDAIKQILENANLFTVDLVIVPSQDNELASFSPDFGKYDLVVMNYDGKTWPEQTRNNFEKFVSNGGGLAVVHSSVIPMSDWPPYNEMIGLGAWGNRNEQNGPYVYWKDGRFVHDNSPGPGGYHGLQRSFAITHRNPEHPILKGLPVVWQHFKDELYAKLRGPAKNMEILATALDEPDRHEPMLWTVNYGKGNVFVTLLGHAGNDPKLRYAMDCAGFQVTLLRGAEWAATGQVTQQAPEDFPREGSVSLRKEYKAPACEKPVRLAFISGMNPVFDTTLYAPLLNNFEGIVWKNYTTEESLELFKPENKDLYDVIVFHSICLEEIPELTKQHIAGVIGEGKPALILHDGLLTYNTWPEFARIAGMKYFMSAQTVDGVPYGVSKYKHKQDIPITVADKEHFITQGMDEQFVLHDEIYNALWQSPDVHVLWTTTHPESVRDVMYTHSYGKGKVAGIVMGHGPDIFFDKNFQLAFRRSIRWLAQTANAQAQIRLTQDAQLENALISTGLIHSPLPLDGSKSFETNGLQKKIIHSEPLSRKNSADGWTHDGLGSMEFSTGKSVSGQGSIKMIFPTFTGKRVQGPSSDPDYATYGNSRISFDVNGANWEKYNRIAFYIYPDCDGARVVNLNLNIQSASHLINLVNKQWNQCFLSLDELQRDKVEQITFSCSLKGKDRSTGDASVFYIDQIELQQIEDPDPVSGWNPGKDKIIYSTSGYLANGPKSAIITVDGSLAGTPFSLLDASTGSPVYTGKVTATATTLGNFYLADFTPYNGSGEYTVKVKDVETPPFPIGDNIWENSLWRTLNFIFCQRCGYPVPGIHGTCHTDLCSVHNGKMISYCGGWHDAGDLSQQTLQTGDVTFALLEAYNKIKDKNGLLAARLLEEAEWGLEFVIRNRYGDGYRASSVGLLIWLDGMFNSLDDISTVRVQNLAFDNFLYAAYEAYAAMTIDRDPGLQEYLARIAKEDFAFALQRHKEVGFGEFIHFYEHSYNTSESQYMATISWAAGMLYKLTKEPGYAELAADYINYTLDCQRKEALGDKDKINGFFYRDKSRKSVVHYIHQSREQVYMQALSLLCETQPQHPNYRKWAESIRLYGDYLKGLMKYTAPYGMLPSGVYHINEYRDSVGFYHLHLWPPANAEDLYIEQVKNGVQVDREHYVKRFPVWFSIFNGNTAVHLSTGKAAAICGKFLKDEELLQIGLEQMYWTVGKNPFGQSLMYGEGRNYPQMDSFSSGEIVGEMPVGIRSLNNEDIPYWPQTNNACYKEVWVTSAGKWLTLAVEYE